MVQTNDDTPRFDSDAIAASFARGIAEAQEQQMRELAEQAQHDEDVIRSVVATVAGGIEDVLYGGDADYDAWDQDGLDDEDGLRAVWDKTVTVYGWSGSGKTTFLTQVVQLLSQQGLRVGVIKHHGHGSPLDAPGKDSARYAQAGAACEVVSSASEYLVHRSVQRERTLVELALEIEPECDVIVAEGFKQQAINAVELYRTGASSQEPIGDFDMLDAVITDDQAFAQAAREQDVRVFDINDVEGFARYVCEQIGWEV